MPELPRRSTFRHELRLPVDVIFGKIIHGGITQNVSLGGAYIELKNPLPAKAVLTVQLHLPGTSEVLRVGAEVRWTKRLAETGGFGVGVRFRGLRTRDVQVLNELFAKHALRPAS